MGNMHNCVKNRIYLEPCGNCPKCKEDPRNCDLLVYGICRICGEIIKKEE
jgi:hypothetical protein